MARYFNIILLVLLAAVYYVQNDGFRTASSAPEPTAVAAVEDTATNEDTPVVDTASVPSNVISAQDLQSIQERFTAEQQLGSVVTIPLPEIDEPQPATEPEDEPEDEPIVQAEVEPDATPDPNILVVTGSRVNARELPTTNSAVLARLTRGTAVAPTGFSDGVWLEVIVLDSGLTVWMHSDFLTEQS